MNQLPLKYKIPRLLCFKIAADKRLKRALGIYFYLKAISDGSGIINLNSEAKLRASELLFCTPRTIELWLSQAITLGLIKKFKDTYYKPVSLNAIREKYSIMHTGFYYVPVGLLPFKDIFLTKFIHEQKQICHAACKFKQNNDVINTEINEVVRQKGIEYSDSGLKNCQIFDFSVGKRFFTEQQRYIMFLINTDYETGCKRYSELLGCTPGAFCYQKKRLKTQNAIDFTARKIIMPEENRTKFLTTKESRETILGHVQYFVSDKSLNLFLPDKIDVYPYKNWKNCRN